MSIFAPTTGMIDPPPDRSVDQLGSAVLRNLSRAPHDRAARGGMIGPLIAGVVTAGVLPLITMPRRFWYHARGETEQLWYAHEWFRLNTVSPAGEPARSDYPPRRPMVTVLCQLARAIGIVALVVLFTYPHRPGMGLRAAIAGLWNAWTIEKPAFVNWFAVAWIVALTIGYSLLIYAIRLHASRVRRQVKRTDELIRQAGLPGIELGPVLGGASWVWLVVGIVLAMGGALWALPMVLAAWMQSGYTTITSPHVREQLLARLRLAMARQTPRTGAVLPRSLQQRCANERCLKRLPPDAMFCPRCGAGVATA
jgi:hypothetical protein